MSHALWINLMQQNVCKENFEMLYLRNSDAVEIMVSVEKPLLWETQMVCCCRGECLSNMFTKALKCGCNRVYKIAN